MRTLILSAAGAALILAACGGRDAGAAEAPTAVPATARPQLPPQTLDGMLERALANFDRLDADKDGRLTAGEREQAGPMGERPGPGSGGRRGFGGLGRADANGDGVVTRAEVEAQVRQRFSRLDANGDGTLTPEEMRARAGRREPG